MKTTYCTMLALLLSLALGASAAQNKKANAAAQQPAGAIDPAKLDAAWKELPTFTYGNDAAARLVADAIVAGVRTEQRSDLELRLLQLLEGKATRDAKDFALRQLVIIGSAASIPRVEPLLIDPEFSHLARYVLGRMEYPQAGEAIHRALGKTTGKLQAGVISTLASRGYAAAVPDIARLVAAPDPIVAQAAITALGDLGGAEAIATLEAARGTVASELKPRVDDALLKIADGLLAVGRKGDAAAVYEKLYAADRPVAVRIGALRGLVQARGDAAGNLIVEGAKNPDRTFAACAIGFSRLVNGPAMSKVLADMLPTLSPQLQETAVRALGDRSDAAALAAVMAATKSAEPGVRVAAIQVLGKIGDASAIGVLATAAAAAGDEQRFGREGLQRLKGDGINAAIVQAIPAAEPKARSELIRALVGRKAAKSADLLNIASTDADAAVRKEAILGMGWTVGAADLPSLIGLASKPRENADRSAIEDAVVIACRRLNDPAKATQIVAAVLASAASEAKPALIRMMRAAASSEAFKQVQAALADPDKAIQDAAIRTLADWPDPAAADDLLNVARTAASQTHQVLALRGYIRMASTVDNPVPMLRKAFDAAQRPDEKKAVLGALGQVGSLAALQVARDALKDPALQNEAGQAIIHIANKLKGNDVEKGKEALQEVISTVKDPRVQKQARDALVKDPPKRRR